MTRQATPKAIEAYREKLLTNPVTFGQRLQQVREDLRSRSEVLFIDRDLTAADKSIDEETRQTEFERLDEMILRIGARIDDLDKQIEEHKKAHPDAELLAKIGPQGQMAGPPAVSRQVRRAMEREQAKAKATREQPPQAPPPQTVPAPEAPPSVGETPKKAEE